MVPLQRARGSNFVVGPRHCPGAGRFAVVEGVVEHAPREPLPERALETNACEERDPTSKPRLVITVVAGVAVVTRIVLIVTRVVLISLTAMHK